MEGFSIYSLVFHLGMAEKTLAGKTTFLPMASYRFLFSSILSLVPVPFLPISYILDWSQTSYVVENDLQLLILLLLLPKN